MKHATQARFDYWRDKLKLCKDCLYCEKSDKGSGFYKCLSARIERVQDPVIGNWKPMYHYCEYARKDPLSCGPDGMFWEPISIYEAAMRNVK
jgi:hypothetical protein